MFTFFFFQSVLTTVVYAAGDIDPAHEPGHGGLCDDDAEQARVGGEPSCAWSVFKIRAGAELGPAELSI